MRAPDPAHSSARLVHMRLHPVPSDPEEIECTCPGWWPVYAATTTTETGRPDQPGEGSRVLGQLLGFWCPQCERLSLPCG